MSQVFAVDANNDLFIASDGNLARASGLAAVLQAAEHAAKTLLSEMMYATDQGIPAFETVWSGSPKLAQFEAYMRRALLAVENVTDVTALTAATSGDALSYAATIHTTYGAGTINA